MSPRREALDVIEGDERLRALLTRVRGLQDDDPGHDMEHCLRVAGWTLRCGAPAVDPREAVAAALLHDVVNVPKDDPRRALASALSAEETRAILPAHGFDEAGVERVAQAVEDHSFSRGATPRSDLGRALQDADRLEALGVLGVFRTISTGTLMGARYFDADDPWAERRDLDDVRHSVDHFFTKLLSLPETLTTEAGRAEARRRVAFMERLLDELGHELGRPRAPAGSARADAASDGPEPAEVGHDAEVPVTLPLFFSTRAHVLVCTGPSCSRRGARELFARTWDEMERRRLAYHRAGGTVRLTESGCQGACDHGPNAIAYFGSADGGLSEAWYAGLDDDALLRIVEALHHGETPPAGGRYDPGGRK